MANDKPFECTEPGCGMSFANEDHLSVHQTKHAMSLALTSGSARPGCILNFVADQTPTPTKFLRNCEEMGLFHELSKNPFEEAFKKAAEEGRHLDMHEQSSPFPVTSLDSDALINHNIVESLNTPTPGALNSLMPTLINMKSNKLTVAATNSQKCTSFSPLPGPDAETGSTLSVVSTSSEVLHTRLTPQVEIVSNLRSGNISSISPAAVDDADSCGSFTTVAVTDDSIACANEMPAGIAMPGVYYILIKSSPGSVLPMPIPPAAPSDANVPVGFPASTTSTLRTLLAIPKSNIEKPVKLEVRSTISCTMTVAAPQSYCSAQPRTVCDVATSSGVAISTKERLKAAIQQNSQVNSVNVMHSNMEVMSDAVDWITANQSRVASATPLSLNRSTSTVGTTAIEPASSVVVRIANQQIQFEDADTSTPPKQMRFSTSDDDAEYRRQQFLERNRAAAARFRVRKKYSMTNLERRAEEVEKLNSSLQMEVGKLRKEVAQLKTMLIAHSDCPVTRLQRDLLAASQVCVVSGPTETENDEAIAMAALSTLADSGSHLAESQIVSSLNNDSANCTLAVDLSFSNVV